MAQTKEKVKAQTSAVQTYASAMDKIRDEMATSKDEKIQLLGEGLTAMLQLHPEWEAHILKDGKNISGALAEVKRNAKGGCSDPIRTTKSLCEYYGITCDDPRKLTIQITMEMVGGTTGTSSDSAPDHSTSTIKDDPFDLDALLGVG